LLNNTIFLINGKLINLYKKNIILEGDFKLDEEHKKILKILYGSYNENPGYQVDNNDITPHGVKLVEKWSR
jgi:hypothetical protein